MKTTRTVYVKGAAVVAGLSLFTLTACSPGSSDEDSSAGDGFTTRDVTDGRTEFVVVTNPGDGATLSYGKDSGVELVTEEVDGTELAFKDLNANGELDPWEDWRLTPEERAADLVDDLTVEEISGLMLFSPHQWSPADGLTSAQEDFLGDHVRSITDASGNDVEDNVTWVNEVQAYVETLDGGTYIPAIFSSDPRSSAIGGYTLTLEGGAYAEAGTGEAVSQWPENLGLAATFDPELVEQATAMQAEEYRALGINVALGPQIDLVTDPRWRRNLSTFGEDTEMSAAMAAAYVAGAQGGDVATTIKHYPGDGNGEGGRESHSEQGKYAVYPSDNQAEALSVFEAALDSRALMVSYSATVASDGGAAFGDGDPWATAFNKPAIDVLRGDGYEGVVVTDWFITEGASPYNPESHRMYGIDEDWTVDEQHYRVLHAGVDMFGGNSDPAPVIAAYDLWQAAYEAGEEEVDAATRWAQTGSRVLAMIFSTGAYDNPFVDLDESLAVVGDEEKMAAGIDAQRRSVVMLKNDGVIGEASLEDYADQTVYIPNTWSLTPATDSQPAVVNDAPSLNADLASQYFGSVVSDTATLNAAGDAVESYATPDLSDVDVVMIGMDTPANNEGADADGQIIPISLQYGPYTADGANVRQVSISGDTLPDGTRENRSYAGRSTTTENAGDLDAFRRAVAAVEASGRDIPIIVVMKAAAQATVIPAEFEADADAFLIGYGIAEQAYFEVALGQFEPQGRLPLGLPDSMDSVEANLEDQPKDHGTYVDAAGNAYAYGFGLNWSGAIAD